jgi:dGTPase
VAAPYARLSETITGAPADDSHEHASRSRVAKDRDRIIHSGALRRLQRKSQIVGVQSADFFRTRLTHTIECSQIARALAQRSLATPDLVPGVVEEPAHLPDLLEAAALAHDLGHPPFGHNGEKALDDCMWRHARGKFEGNAQSLRIATYLEPRIDVPGERFFGLDLTRTTLKAILKYPITEQQAIERAESKFCIYDTAEDAEVFAWMFDGEAPARTVATDMLEAADDIAYAVHDFEDGVWSGLIPLFSLIDGDRGTVERDRVTAHLEAKDAEREAKGKVALFSDQSVAAVLDELAALVSEGQWARRPFDRSRPSRARLKQLSSHLIGDFVDAATPDDRFQSLTGAAERRIETLKALAWLYMIEAPDRERSRYGQRRIVTELFEGFWSNPSMLPNRDEWRRVADAGPTPSDQAHSENGDAAPEKLDVWKAKARLICDEVAGMTDLYALHVHQEMHGGGGPGLLRI